MNLTIAEAYANLNDVLDYLRKNSVDQELIESVLLGQKALLALEMLGIASKTDCHSQHIVEFN